VESVALDQSLADSRAKLFAVRSRRVAPGRDDKLLVAWNGLAIDAMARGYQVLGDERYLAAARRAARFILDNMTRGGSPRVPHLLHCYKDGQARFTAYLDDYACLIDSLVSLYESDFDECWLGRALDLAAVMVDQFWDDGAGNFFYTPRDHEPLITRVRDTHDGATPSGNSMAVTALARLGRLTGRAELIGKAERALGSFAGLMTQASMAAGQMLIALDFLLDRPLEIVIVAGDSDSATPDAALRLVRRRFLPNSLAALRGAEPAGDSPVAALLAGKHAVDGNLTVYLCRNFACQSPIVRIDELERAIDAL
jgi:uncharacterized protein YyaL (SSP411 family)